MATKDGDADTGCGNLDIVITHDFLGFDNHLPLFLGGIVFQELIDMGNAVEGDLMSESIDSELFAVQELLSLRVQLLHRLGTCTRSSLVGRNNHALDGRNIIERLQSCNHLDGGAIGVGDNAARPSNVLGVNLGNNQRHIFVHTESTGIVDHHSTGIYDSLAHFLGNACTCAEQRNVDTLERFGSHLLNSKFTCGNLAAALKRKLLTRRTL